ncbi:hypothetical protein BBK36DRAFT_1184447 [Trichoderma citrinoviride]|uniref:Uncharacterized protein n=1 Tax=Trichoderma citrinoviride TaxID=58853 RepID=A0A2T4AZS6_9HYPO|nr:hypothetical protein BBK36DRAFT_1184447 [Trichoderma citrinoviride]PTB62575.1 hypothetical protein BBK36DRAFT_1184447 [Trichoderma citrinoviride]
MTSINQALANESSSDTSQEPTMQRAAAASSSAASHGGDHLLQGGHAILKDDPEPMAQDVTSNTRNVSEAASQQHQQPHGYGGTKASDLEQAGGGVGEGARKRDTQSHPGRIMGET